MLVAYNEGRWEKDWLLVEALHEAEVATILVSQDSTSEVLLSANVSELLASISLADPSISFSVGASRGQLVKSSTPNGYRPAASGATVRRTGLAH